MAAPKGDPVHLPEHYARYKIEPIRFITENKLPFIPGNVIKYVLRWDAKDGIQDLKKARRYIDMLIAHVEGNEDWWTSASSPAQAAVANNLVSYKERQEAQEDLEPVFGFINFAKGDPEDSEFDYTEELSHNGKRT